MLSNFVSKNWRLTSMPMYFGLNIGLAYYKYEIDGIKKHLPPKKIIKSEMY